MSGGGRRPAIDPRDPRTRRILQVGAIGAGGLFVLLIVALVGLYAWGAQRGGLARLTQAWAGRSAVVLTWDDGSPITRRRPPLGVPIDVDDMPNVWVVYTLAEDDGFYEHDGADIRAIARALLTNYAKGEIHSGASTITQQVVKNAIFCRETPRDCRAKTPGRKLEEIFVASNLEDDLKRAYSALPAGQAREERKKALLGFYLASTNFGTAARIVEGVRRGGGDIIGIDLAARLYFGKAPQDLSIAEAAILQAVSNSPSRHICTARGWEAAKAYALAKLVNIRDKRRVQKEHFTEAIQELQVAPRPPCPREPSSVNWPLQVIEAQDAVAKAPPSRGRLPTARVLRTTLNAQAQNAAAAAVQSVLSELPAALQAAFVAVRGDGSVVAMVGGRDFDASVGFNRATPKDIPRQIGSIYKGFIFASALQNGARVTDVCDAGSFTPPRASWTIPGEEGALTLRRAFAESTNSVAVRVAYGQGAAAVGGLARRLGMRTIPKSEYPAWPLSADGSALEVATAFAAFGNGGRPVRPAWIVGEAEPGERILSDAALAGMAAIGTAVRSAGGTAPGLDLPGLTFAAKTGTSTGNRDRWVAVWGPDFALAVWVGRDDARALPDASVKGVPEKIARRFLETQALGWGRRPWGFTTPEGPARPTPSLEPNPNFCV